jgi:hypothetical protein
LDRPRPARGHPPSIDPFSAKNRELDARTVGAILATVGLIAGGDPADGPIHFERRDGSSGTVPSDRTCPE